jgi:hypothetical protein
VNDDPAASLLFKKDAGAFLHQRRFFLRRKLITVSPHPYSFQETNKNADNSSRVQRQDEVRPCESLVSRGKGKEASVDGSSFPTASLIRIFLYKIDL